MKPKDIVPRILVFFLALSLTLPGSALALRQTGLEESEPTKQKLLASLRTSATPVVNQPNIFPGGNIPGPAAKHAAETGLEEPVVPKLYPTIRMAVPFGDRVMTLAFDPKAKVLLFGKLGHKDAVQELTALRLPSGEEFPIPERIQAILKDPDWEFKNAVFSPDGQRLYVHSMSRPRAEEPRERILMFDWVAGEQRAEEIVLEGWGDWEDIALSPDGKTLYALSSPLPGILARPHEYVIRLFNAETGDHLSGADIPISDSHAEEWAITLLPNPDGRRLHVYFHESRRVRTYDLSAHRWTGPTIQAERVGYSGEGIKKLAISSDGKTLYVGSTDPELLAYDLESAEKGRPYPTRLFPESLVIDSEGVLTVISRGRGLIEVLRSELPEGGPIRIGQDLPRLEPPASGLEELNLVMQYYFLESSLPSPVLIAFNPHDQTVVIQKHGVYSFYEDPPILAYKVPTRENVSVPETLLEVGHQIERMRFSPKGDALYLVGPYGRSTRSASIIYSWPSGEAIEKFQVDDVVASYSHALAESPDGESLFILGKKPDGKWVIRVNAKRGKPHREDIPLARPPGYERFQHYQPEEMLFHPNGSRLYVLYRFADPSFTAGLPDGVNAVSAVYVYDVSTGSIGQPILQMEPVLWKSRQRRFDVSAFKRLAISPDGKELFVGVAEDGDPVYDQIHLFDAESGRRLNQTKVAGRLVSIDVDSQGVLTAITTVVASKDRDREYFQKLEGDKIVAVNVYQGTLSERSPSQFLHGPRGLLPPLDASTTPEAGLEEDYLDQLSKLVPGTEGTGSAPTATGLEKRVPAWLKPALGADWMEVVHGVYEMAQVTDKIAVLIQPELLGVTEGDGETQVALMSIEGNLHGAFGWPEQTTLRLGLLTPQSVEAFEGKGYRVIRVVRHPESEGTPLPWEAVPVVVAEALAGGRSTFLVNVTPYLNLKGITLPEILATLTDLFA